MFTGDEKKSVRKNEFVCFEKQKQTIERTETKSSNTNMHIKATLNKGIA